MYHSAVDKHLKAQLPDDDLECGPMNHIQVEYLPEGRNAVPDTCYECRQLEFEKDFVKGVWVLLHGWDWGECEIQTGNGVPQKRVAADIPKEWVDGILKLEYKSHEQMSEPHNGQFEVSFGRL